MLVQVQPGALSSSEEMVDDYGESRRPYGLGSIQKPQFGLDWFRRGPSEDRVTMQAGA